MVKNDKVWKNLTTKCPFCSKVGRNCEEEILTDNVKNATVLLICEEGHLWGRCT